jgi:hypothetical protein
MAVLQTTFHVLSTNHCALTDVENDRKTRLPGGRRLFYVIGGIENAAKQSGRAGA